MFLDLLSALDVTSVIFCLSGIAAVAFAKGAVGGGFALLGIPIMSIGMDPLQAGAVLAMTLIAMDVVSLRYWRPSSWSIRDAAALMPGVATGMLIGFLALSAVNKTGFAVLFSFIILAIIISKFAPSKRRGEPKERSAPLAMFAGLAGGFSSMVVHAGGPPLSLYLNRIGLPKQIYAGTMSIVVTIGNLLKVTPWLLVTELNARLLTLFCLSLPVIPIAIHVGWICHGRISDRSMQTGIFVLLALTSIFLLSQSMDEIIQYMNSLSLYSSTSQDVRAS